MKKTLTVFTPTYNRAYCLNKCYESLKRQSLKDFIWLIIDDGSSDNTKELVESWKKENIIPIQYYYKENGGMHTAHNVAYELIDTELNVCIDSDDYMPDDAVEKIIKFWNENGDKNCGGIYALDAYENGQVIGSKFPEELKSFKGYGYKRIFSDKGKSYKITGDKKFISVTKVLKSYPSIPVYQGEKYYSLYYKQHLIERDYRILLMNEVVCIVEYMEDGSSKNMIRQYIKNPRGFADMRKLVMTLAPKFSLRFREAIHYVSSSFILKNKNFIKESPKKLETILAIPFGIVLFSYIIIQYNKLFDKEGIRK